VAAVAGCWLPVFAGRWWALVVGTRWLLLGAAAVAAAAAMAGRWLLVLLRFRQQKGQSHALAQPQQPSRVHSHHNRASRALFSPETSASM